MRNIILLVLSLILGVIYLNIRSIKNTSFFYNEINLTNANTNLTEKIEISDYLIGVVAAEMPASFDINALKAQAIASRTFLYNKILNDKNYLIKDDTTFQAYINNDEMHQKWGKDYEIYYQKIKMAVESTGDLVITYNDKIIKSYYFAMSNGYTENAINVFSEEEEYLKSVISNEDQTNKNFLVKKIISLQEFKSKLNITNDDINISSITYDESKRVKTIVINNKSYSGIDIRKLLDLRSTDFTIDINDNIVITTKGYGHGVGMSQYGANTMALKGCNYEDIIKHYYTDTKITNINSIKN